MALRPLLAPDRGAFACCDVFLLLRQPYLLLFLTLGNMRLMGDSMGCSKEFLVLDSGRIMLSMQMMLGGGKAIAVTSRPSHLLVREAFV